MVCQNPKLCEFFRFEKEYFKKLKEVGVVVVRPSNWAGADMVDEEVESVHYGGDQLRKALEDNLSDDLRKALQDSVGDKLKKALEEKVDNMVWKMNMCIICAACVVLGALVVYVTMK